MPRRESVIILYFVAVVFSAADARADTLRMPEQQAAIEAAQPGDVVLVADGVYIGEGNKNLDFGGKDIVVRSENGPAACVIDCEGSGRGVYLHSGETDAAAVEGITVTNGCVANGGGLLFGYSAVAIRHCSNVGNSADGDGTVQLPDLAGLLSRFGTASGATPANGDSDLDGDVDLSDLVALLVLYGSHCP